MNDSEDGISITEQQTESDAQIIQDEKDSPDGMRAILTAHYNELYSGPLPPPEILAGYEKTLPGIADRLVSVFEENVKHSQEIEIKRLEASILYTARGQNRGLIITLVGLAIGIATVILSTLNQSGGATISGVISGSAVSGISILRLVSKFIDGPKKEKKNGNDTTD